MKKLALTLAALFAFSTMAFAMDNVNLDGKLDSGKLKNAKKQDKSLIAEVGDGVTFQVDSKSHKIQSVRYTKRGAKYKAISIGDEWNFHRATGISDFSYNRGGNSYHFFTEKDGSATVYETENSRIIAITRIAKSYYETAKKYHNQKQLGIIK
ncbi:MAG: hypothetical protein J6M62_01960 [Selenomonadaceae bacterium]|nr:hypothetical protein [Selenomonadaceae bacterium]MBP3721669.1 hypothetical protein [Selenomonadaceae bacterium]